MAKGRNPSRSSTPRGSDPLEPGDYVAFGVIDGQQVTASVEFTIEACATADPDQHDRANAAGYSRVNGASALVTRWRIDGRRPRCPCRVHRGATMLTVRRGRR